MMLIFPDGRLEWHPEALACLVFALPFALHNRRPRSIYIGDAGSFAFACLLTTIAVAFVHRPASVAPEFALPAALPALDVFVVFFIRVREKHDLLTRNYLHLYQRLAGRYDGFGYLLPQIVGLVLALAGAVAFRALGTGRAVAVVLAGIFVTIPFYFACRAYLLPGPEAAART
jgi:UDP-N-acetylmuramyl pentapeptide phosphotransferase/UDP-N-acetylglucosamine-1-phosphate transferase